MIWSGASDVEGTISGKLQAMKRRFSWGMQNIKLIDIYSLDQASILKGYLMLKKHQPVLIRAISSGLYRFCVGLKSLELDGKQLGLKGVIFTGEGFPEAQREFVEEVLGCPTICEYGCTELGIIGFECPERKIHLLHENLIFEFIKDGLPAKTGEVAELVVTNLRNYTAPLIRYSVGDLVVSSSKSCSCKRTLPVIEGIQGRLHDTILTPDGAVIHGLFFTHLFDRYSQIHQFRVIQETLNELNIETVSLDKLDNTLIQNIKRVILSKFGKQVKVNITQVSSLPISTRGKTPWIISKVHQNV